MRGDASLEADPRWASPVLYRDSDIRLRHGTDRLDSFALIVYVEAVELWT